MGSRRFDWCGVHESRRSQPASAFCQFAVLYPAASAFCRFLLVEIVPVDEKSQAGKLDPG